MILNESGIDDDMTFYAQWDISSISEEENPKTFDNIGYTIIMLTISIIGLASIAIFLKKIKY